MVGLENVCDQWTGLQRIKERTAAASMSMVGGRENILVVDAKVALVVQGDVHVLKAVLKCNS